MSDERSAILEICTGPLAQRRALVAPGGVLRVGRTSLSDFAVPHDEQMSQVHWELRWDGERCELRDLGSVSGTLLAGVRVEQAEVVSGAWIRAGGTDFTVHFEARPAAAGPGDESKAAVLARLGEIADKGALFAVLDGARSERIVPLLRTHVDEPMSLYEGTQGDAMADIAPYLVRIEPGSRLLPTLVEAGWGASWGVYLESQAPIREVRSHLRKLLVVTREKDRVPMFFRFYDPRVLRAFVPIATARQAGLLFGPIRRFLVEDAGREVLCFDAPAEATIAAGGTR